MAKSIFFGDYFFKTKSSAVRSCQERIAKYDHNDYLDGEDEKFFASLLTLHEEYEEKIGCGLEKIRVQRDIYKNMQLCIIRSDGTEEIFSWRHCIQPHSKYQIVSYAFRRAVKERIIKFKRDKVEQQLCCPYYKVPLNLENSHAAYSPKSFKSLLLEFLSGNQLTIDMIELTDPISNDDDQRAMLADESLKLMWTEYHDNHAKLILISAEANWRGLKK